MKIEYKNKDWDSNFFGYKVGEATIDKYTSSDYFQMQTVFREKGFKLVYLHPANIEILNELSKNNITSLDTKTTFSKNKDAFVKHPDNENIESYFKDDQYPCIIKLSLASGEFSRYSLDERFKNNEFNRLYKEWVDKSLSRSIADDVLIYRLNNRVTGFITYKISNYVLTIGLIAVEEHFRGAGIGKSLMETIENVAHTQKLESIHVATQGQNTIACNFYRKCNYSVLHTKDICHLWIK